MSKLILVADDDNGQLLMMESLLTGRGYTVVLAHDGEQAVEKARRAKPDLIIMDVQMPMMEGDEAAMVLLETPETRGIPVIFCTGLRTDEELAETKEENVFAKPVHFETLLAKIKETLGE